MPRSRPLKYATAHGRKEDSVSLEKSARRRSRLRKSHGDERVVERAGREKARATDSFPTPSLIARARIARPCPVRVFSSVVTVVVIRF